jgi:hypothetical protein
MAWKKITDYGREHMAPGDTGWSKGPAPSTQRERQRGGGMRLFAEPDDGYARSSTRLTRDDPGYTPLGQNLAETAKDAAGGIGLVGLLCAAVVEKVWNDVTHPHR